MAASIPPYISPNGRFSLDLRCSGLDLDALRGLDSRFQGVHAEMQAIEAGEIKNPDEQRRVTHFTDRQKYPGTPLFNDVEQFFRDLRDERLVGSSGQPFEALVMNGIGGSALGPQMLQFALNGPYWNELSAAQRGKAPKIYFTDNTDAAGVCDILAVVDLAKTLVVTVSKSGSTQETANNMNAFAAAFAEAELDFTRHAAAVTMPGSVLDGIAREHKWLKIWPMADSIGGRTSETAIVGHVPAAAASIDFGALLQGACDMDTWTRSPKLIDNPAYQLAAAWYLLGNGQGDKNMVIVPYADRLVLLSRYLQQLVMESLGKELDLDGKVVHQGLSVYGNKGGTDAHAYIQQLNDGRNDFFATFIEILEDAAPIVVDGELTMGDHLHNFLQGLVNALHGRQRSVLTVTLDRLDAATVGMLIALYERAVAAYAELIHVNAFHQPGVQAYKRASRDINALMLALREMIASEAPGFSGDAAAFAAAVGRPDMVDETAGVLAKLAVNRRGAGGHVLERTLQDGQWRFRICSADA